MKRIFIVSLYYYIIIIILFISLSKFCLCHTVTPNAAETNLDSDKFILSMLLILDGTLGHVAHAWRKIGLFGFVTAVDLLKCLKQIKLQNCSLRAHLFLSYHLIKVPRSFHHHSLPRCIYQRICSGPDPDRCFFFIWIWSLSWLKPMFGFKWLDLVPF